MKSELQPEHTERIQWLDTLKGILILFVILSHSYPAKIYERLFTPFFLTMFFFASGYTFSLKKNLLLFLKNKWKHLLCPFFILGLIRVLLSFLLEGGSFTKRLTGFLLQQSCKNDEMWFLSCLFICSFLFYIILQISRQIPDKYETIFLLGISFFFMLMGMADMCVWKLKFLWEAEIACMMVFYLTLGYLSRKHHNELQKILNRPSYIAALSLLYLAVVILLPNDVNIHSENFQHPLIFWISSMLIPLPIIYLSKTICRFHCRSFFSFLGKNTIFYYAFSGCVRILLYPILHSFGISDMYIRPLLCVVITVIVLAPPAQWIRRFFPWAVGA